MKSLLSLALIMLSSMALGADYQDAVLLSFRDVPTGENCSGSVNGNNVNSNCYDTTERQFTVKVSGQNLVIVPSGTKKRAGLAIATLGWSEIPRKGSVLRDQLPGSHFLIKSDSSGMYVKVGKKQSKFRVVEAN